jgi:hypothetical protein
VLIARARSFRASAWDLTSGVGEPVATLELNPGQDGAALIHGEQSYRIGRAGVVSGPWQLRQGDELVFEALKAAGIDNRLITTVKGAELEIAPKGRGLKRFGVVGPDWTDLGEIRSRPPFGRTLHVDLDELIPVAAQLFLTFQAIAIAKGFELE